MDFHTLVADGIRNLTPYQPGKPIEEVQRELGLEHVAKLASNENPLGPSPLVIQAIQSGSKDIWLYPDGNGYYLKQQLATKHSVHTSQITLGNGSSDPLDFVTRVFVSSGEEVIFSQHSFAIYPLLTAAVNGKGVVVPAQKWGNDLDAMLAAVTSKTKVIFIANPNNPTGTWLSLHSIRTFLQQVPVHIIVVLDEAYYEYAYDFVPHDIGNSVELLQQFPNLVITRTFSKAYALAGLRIGYALSGKEITDLLNRVRPPFNVNSLALLAAQAALQDRAHLEKSVALNRQGMEQVVTGITTLGLQYIPSAGNFLAIDMATDATPYYQGLMQAGVIVRPVANYQMPTYLRVSIGLPEENDRFLNGLQQLLRQSH